jgi:hypothetical protein
VGLPVNTPDSVREAYGAPVTLTNHGNGSAYDLHIVGSGCVVATRQAPGHPTGGDNWAVRGRVQTNRDQTHQVTSAEPQPLERLDGRAPEAELGGLDGHVREGRQPCIEPNEHFGFSLVRPLERL